MEIEGAAGNLVRGNIVAELTSVRGVQPLNVAIEIGEKAGGRLTCLCRRARPTISDSGRFSPRARREMMPRLARSTRSWAGRRSGPASCRGGRSAAGRFFGNREFREQAGRVGVRRLGHDGHRVVVAAKRSPYCRSAPITSNPRLLAAVAS